MTEHAGCSAVVEAVRDHLAAGVSVNLVGLRGSGRSETVARVVERLVAEGRTTMPVRGVAALQGSRYAALELTGVLLPRRSGHGDFGTVTAQVAEQITARGVIVADDAEDLDLASARALLAAHECTGAPVLAVSRPESAQAVTSAISGVAPAAVVIVPPLRHGDVDRIARTRLGGGLDVTSLGRITTVCGGLPGLVVAVLDAATASGALVDHDGLWGLDGAVWSPDLGPAVAGLLGDLGAAAMEALRVLALAGALAVEHVQGSALWPEYLALERAGLVHPLRTRDVWEIVLFPPLLAVHLLRTSTALQRVRAEAVLDDLGPDRVDRDQSSGALRVSGIRPCCEQIVPVGHRILHYWKEQAVCARAAWLADPGPATAVAYLEALGNTSAEPALVRDVLATTPRLGPTPARVGFVAWWAGHLAVVDGDLPAAVDLLRRERTALPAFDGALRAVEGHLRLMTDRVPEESLLADPADGEERASAEALHAVRAEVRVAQGRQRDALRELAAVGDDGTGAGGDAAVVHGLALILEGRLDAARAWGVERFHRALRTRDLTAVDGQAYVATVAMVLTARMSELDRQLAAIASLARTPTRALPYQAGILATGSVMASAHGREAGAVALAEQAVALSTGLGPFPGMSPTVALALARAVPQAGGDAGADAAWQAAEDRIGRGYLAHGIVLGVLALDRVPDLDRAHRLDILAGTGQSPLLQHLTGYVVAVAEGDAESLRRVAGRLRHAGLRLYGVRAVIHAARSLYRSGQAPTAARLAFEGWELAHAMGTESVDALAALVDDLGLTDRERQIATMLAHGTTGTQIAAELVLSERTIEQHILRACRKTGLCTRDDLAQAARTWLSVGLGRPPATQRHPDGDGRTAAPTQIGGWCTNPGPAPLPAPRSGA